MAADPDGFAGSTGVASNFELEMTFHSIRIVHKPV